MVNEIGNSYDLKGIIEKLNEHVKYRVLRVENNWEKFTFHPFFLSPWFVQLVNN